MIRDMKLAEERRRRQYKLIGGDLVPVSKFVGVFIVGILVGAAIGYGLVQVIVPSTSLPLTDESISFVYTAFNTPQEIVKVLSRNCANFSVIINYNVTFNATTPADVEALPKAIIKMRNATSGDICGLDIEGRLRLLYRDDHTGSL